MPSTTTIYEVMPNGVFKPKADIGPVARNSFFFSPEGHSFCVGGFGNLPGELDFYDMATFKKTGSTESHMATSWAWSPDGRFFACAICAPRRHVDNGFKVYNSVGALLYKEDIEELYDFVWRPDAATTAKFKAMKTITPVPQPEEMAKATAAAAAAVSSASSAGAAAAGKGGNGAAPKKTGAYVPPHLRGKTRPAPVLGSEVNNGTTMYDSNGSLLTGGKKQAKGPASASAQTSVPFGFSPISEPGSASTGKKKNRRRK